MEDGSATTEACSLPADPASVKGARDFATAALRRWEMPGLIDDMGLIVSELVTNALNHAAPASPEEAAAARAGTADGAIRLNLIRRGAEVICTVGDSGTDAPIRRDDVLDVAETGRGLMLVEALSQAWGWTPLRDSGKVVWALLAEPDRPA